MRKSVAVATTAVLLGCVGALTGPAQAETTSVSFQVSSGTLTLTAAASAPQGTAQLGSSGATVTIPLGTTTVKDTRLTATSWSMTATASDFVTTGGSVSKQNAAFSVEAGWTAPTLMSVPVFSKPPALTPESADANGSRVLMTTTLGVLNNGLVFTPVLTLTVPPGSVAGVYTGTVTQSVA